MRNALCHLSISAVSLQHGASFVITLVKLLICHQRMMRLAEVKGYIASVWVWWVCVWRGGGGQFYQREWMRSQLYMNRGRKPRPTASLFIIILTCGQSIIRHTQLSDWGPSTPKPISSTQQSLPPATPSPPLPPHTQPYPTPTVADDIVTLITANCSALDGFSHIANDTPLVSVTMFPQNISMGTGNLHKWM